MEPSDPLDALLAGADQAIAASDPNATPPISGPGDTFVPPGDPGQPKRVYIYTGNKEGNPQGVPGGVEVPLPAGSGDGTSVSGAPQSPPGSGTGTTATIPQMTPDVDAQAKQLDQLDQLAAQAMKEGGFTGYVPPIQDAVKTPEGRQSLYSAVTDFAAGFNHEAAKAVALPEEVFDKGMALLGLDYMQHGSPTQRTINAIARMGIPIYQVENEANKLGQGALPALATWAAIQASAPMLAARTGVSATQMVMKEIGDWALKHPVLGMWLGQTSAAGGQIARDKAGDNPLVGLAGELAGGIAGGGVARIGMATGRFAGRTVGRAVNAAVDWAGAPTAVRNMVQKYNPLYQVPPKPFTESVADAVPDIAYTQSYAEDQVAGLKMQMDDAVSRAVASVRSTGPSNVQQRVMHSNLQEAEKISNRLVEDVWKKVDQSIRVPVKDMFNDIVDFRASIKDTPSIAPVGKIKEGLRLSGLTRDPNTGQMVRTLPTVRRLRDFISSIRNEVVREQASDAPRDGYIRNLNRLAAIVEDNIANQFPQNTRLAQARAASTLHHDMFSRGPIADILAKRYRGDFRIDPSGSVEALLQRPDGVKAVRDMVTTLSNPKYPTTADEKRIIQQVQTDMENSLRNMWREEAANGPDKAVRWNSRIQGQIKALARVASELQLASQKAATAAQVNEDIGKSALARYAATSAEKAVKNLFAQRNPADIARQLIRQLSGDPDALRGFQSQVVQELIGRAKSDPVNMRNLLNTPHIQQLIEAVLTSSQRGRLNKIVNDSIRLTSGEDKGFIRHNFLRFTLLGRIMGAWVGRALPGTTLQGQAIFARGGARLAEKLFKATPPEQMMKLAIIDPNWEQMLYSRFPTTVKEMRIAARHYRRLFALADNARKEASKALGMDK